LFYFRACLQKRSSLQIVFQGEANEMIVIYIVSLRKRTASPGQKSFPLFLGN